ncbi:MAG: sigma-54-dependent Fis family transcriptional regulator [Deltaproteobacteria bacterium]|nr:sigma-54-dependent Fis family transcriptional regulator [Deltaproteobacteria bacterium]
MNRETSTEHEELNGSVTSPRGRLLVVDDESTARRALATLLTDDGYQVETAGSGEEGLERLAAFAPDVLITDVRMPGMDGVELLARARALDPTLVVVVMTAFGTVKDAVRAMKAGAEHYVTKPVDLDELLLVLERVFRQRALQREAGLLRARVRAAHRFENLLGASAPMQSLFKTILQVAPSRATVLLTGESGTGKERVAQAIHEASPRASGPFVKLHCAALAETLLESELFGHEKGAFTGAVARREGRFRLAHGGTLFLDEISEISPGLQVKLLRVLQERAFERVGGNETLKVDVRIIAATNRDLEKLVKEGRFREDLFYRLNVVGLVLPPLRQRREDIPLLAEHFLRRFADEAGKPLTAFTPDAMAALQGHAWVGNVRELENAVERAVVLASGTLVRAEHLSLPGGGVVERPLVPTTSAVVSSLGPAPTVPGSTLAELERYAILSTMEHCHGSTHRTAELLDVSVRMIQYRLREYRHGIKRAPAPLRMASGH